eukprot:Gregarina_sp_Poly_1__7270@NODE_39_length_18147_cov_101_572069_g34_i0_p3_GENE_NODE_39_length_18147_cov_101_572069_g34_i0NODE_39_length_18147_cov_101_572069_g34_i0_p3_ORF_typecomplete_len514_score91_06RED_N/PF07808_13/1_6e15RED_N/PF07808_13/1_2e03TetR_C_27/PF17935_1/0_17_NODE_39_length_18147_cov_101_572069_g34_i018873428
MKNLDFRNALFAEEGQSPAANQSTPQPPRSKPAVQQEEDGYIDRAKIRRAIERELRLKQATASTSQTDVLTTFRQIVGASEANELTAEERQMLGGDEEHTYLVKGLDTALLEKTRREIQEVAQKKEREAPVPPGDVSAYINPWAQQIVQDFVHTLNPHNRKFHKQLDLIYCHITRGGRFKGNSDIFRRMYYLFDSTDSQPRTLFRSGLSSSTESELWDQKESGPKTLVVAIEDQVASLINATIGAGGSYKKIIRSEKETIKNQAAQKKESATESNCDETEDEIFPSVGPLDTAALTREILESRTEADKAEIERRRQVAKGLRAKEERDMRAAEDLLVSASSILKEAEAKQVAEEAKRKRLLERPPDEPVADNPFSLKNASLMPLVNRRPSVSDTRLGSASREAWKASQKIDEEYGLTNFDQWQDEDGPATQTEKLEYNLSQMFARKLNKSENDPEVCRRVAKAMARNRHKTKSESEEKQWGKIDRILKEGGATSLNVLEDKEMPKKTKMARFS